MARVPDGDIVATLEVEHARTLEMLERIDPARETFRPSDGRWSVREVVGHLIDTERVFTGRLLWFARGGTDVLPGMDQDAWVAVDAAHARPLGVQLAEWRHVRAGLVALLEGLEVSAWQREGVASGSRVTVPALAWIVAGHELHHRELFRTDYGIA